jgi:hypothetical protein
LFWWHIPKFFSIADSQDRFSLQPTEFIDWFFFDYLSLIGYATNTPILQGAHGDTNNFTGWLLARPMKHCYGY